MLMKKLWDISPPVDEASPVFPGDTTYKQDWVSQISSVSPVNVCRLELTSHIGSHADAPLHYDTTGKPVGMLDLLPYIGKCRVIDARHASSLIQLEDVAHALVNLPARVLIRGYDKFPQQAFDFQCKALAPEMLWTFAEKGVLLIGTDSASVDPVNSQKMPSHNVLRLKDMRVLENLFLDEVPPGDYELIALPLKLMRADASPVRAVLREL